MTVIVTFVQPKAGLPKTAEKVIYDADLSGRPVSNSSTTYPGVALGHMRDGVALGYQAAMVSMHSSTYGRVWLSVKPHPGDQVACALLEELVRSAETNKLAQRLALFEQENRANPFPIRADFCIDAGFSPPENVALLIELGYEVYTRPYDAWLRADLKRQTNDKTEWTRVGKNAEMVAWAAQLVSKCPYPLDVAPERFYIGDTLKHSVLIHYGQDAVTSDLPAWFHTYNGRQTIEAGIKEGKNVFEMHHLKVRSEAALFLQEHLAVFAANLVRWAAHRLVTECLVKPDNLDLADHPQASIPGVKDQG